MSIHFIFHKLAYSDNEYSVVRPHTACFYLHRSTKVFVQEDENSIEFY